jgi:AdoMet-dependent rRNA methyltransferase SPB1
MQLQMTAPLDIGLEQSDAALGVGQDDVFDLGEAEKHINRKTQVQWLNEEALETISDVDESEGKGGLGEEEEEEEEEDNVPSLDEERDRRVDALEAELDGLYDAYRDRLCERDAKFKVKEERMKNKEQEKEWSGIRTERDSDGESTDSEGGWDLAQRNKLKDSDDSSDESSAEGEEEKEDAVPHQKCLRADKDAALPSAKRLRLVDTSEPESKPSSATVRLWFDQDVFSSVDIANDLAEDGDEDEEQNMSDISPIENDDETDQVHHFSADLYFFFLLHSDI